MLAFEGTQFKMFHTDLIVNYPTLITPWNWFEVKLEYTIQSKIIIKNVAK